MNHGVIKPQVGHPVILCSFREVLREDGSYCFENLLRAAVITKVVSDRRVNLAVFEEDGTSVSDPPKNVFLRQPRDEWDDAFRNSAGKKPKEDRCCYPSWLEVVHGITLTDYVKKAEPCPPPS